MKGCRSIALVGSLTLIAISFVMANGGPLAESLVYLAIPAAIIAVPVLALLAIWLAVRSTDKEVGPRRD